MPRVCVLCQIQKTAERHAKADKKKSDLNSIVMSFVFSYFSLELHPQISHKLVSLFLFLHRILCAHFTPNTTSNNFIFNPIKWTIFSDYSSSYSFFILFSLKSHSKVLCEWKNEPLNQKITSRSTFNLVWKPFECEFA